MVRQESPSTPGPSDERGPGAAFTPGIHAAVCDGIRWEIDPEAFPSGIEEFRRALESRKEVLRALPGREVALHDLPDGRRLVVKAFKPRRARDGLRYLLLPSPARTERDRAVEALARGIKVPRPLASGERRTFAFLRESILVLEYVEGRPLDRWFENLAKDDVRRKAFMETLGGFLADVHDRGLVHRDLHPGNILLRHEEGRFSFTLVDLRAARFRTSLSRKERVFGLAQMNLYFFRTASKTERMRFLKGYLQEGCFPKERRALALRVERATEDAARRYWEKIEKRCTGQNKYFSRFRNRGFRGFFRKGTHWPLPGTDLAEVFTSGRSRVLKDSAGALSVLFETGGRMVYGKLFRAASVLDVLKDTFRPSRALKAWKRSIALEVRGVSTPSPLGAASRRGFLRPVVSVFFSEGLPDAVCLDRFSRECRAGGREGGARLRRLVSVLGKLVGSLHRLGFSHRDLKAGNILLTRPDECRVSSATTGSVECRVSSVEKQEARSPFLDTEHSTLDTSATSCEPGPREWEPTLTDLEGLHYVRKVSLERREKDLARLFRSARDDCGFTRADWVRLLRAYVSEAGPAAGDLGGLISGVARRAGTGSEED